MAEGSPVCIALLACLVFTGAPDQQGFKAGSDQLESVGEDVVSLVPHIVINLVHRPGTIHFGPDKVRVTAARRIGCTIEVATSEDRQSRVALKGLASNSRRPIPLNRVWPVTVLVRLAALEGETSQRHFVKQVQIPLRDGPMSVLMERHGLSSIKESPRLSGLLGARHQTVCRL